jgi:mRNA-degrading endonuclease RelE of RelBE toxin-antitoxin system
MDNVYAIKATDYFKRSFYRLIPKNKQADMRRRILKLRYAPYVGRPLGFMFLRELKLGKFRVYYLVQEQEILVILVDVSDKKDQKETINSIKRDINFIEESVKNLKNKGLE